MRPPTSSPAALKKSIPALPTRPRGRARSTPDSITPGRRAAFDMTSARCPAESTMLRRSTDSTAGCCDLKPPSRRVARVRDRTMLPTKFHLAIVWLCIVLPSGREKVVSTLTGSSNARLQGLHLHRHRNLVAAGLPRAAGAVGPHLDGKVVAIGEPEPQAIEKIRLARQRQHLGEALRPRLGD